MQVSLFQIDNYGPWTVTPTPRRETDLQSLQARLYADLADFLGQFDGYAFYDRFDNMVGVTNGINREQHAAFQERVKNRYPITLSVAIHAAQRPAVALRRASTALQSQGSAQDADRTEVLAGNSAETPGTVTIAHFDVVDVTSQYTDQASAAATTLAMQRATISLSQYLLEHYDSLAHFVGGDNIIAVCPRLEPAAFQQTIDHVADQTGIDLQVGFGRGGTAHEAGYRAKEALELCRETGQRVANSHRSVTVE